MHSRTIRYILLNHVDDDHVGRQLLGKLITALGEGGEHQRTVGDVEPAAEGDDPGYFLLRHASAPVGQASMHLPHPAQLAGNPASKAVATRVAKPRFWNPRSD